MRRAALAALLLLAAAPARAGFFGPPSSNGGAVTGPVSITTAPTSGAAAFSVNTSSFVVKASSVGINTATPILPLDVNGAAQFGSGATRSTFTATGSLTMAAGASLTIGGVAVVSSTVAVSHISGGILVGTLASGTTFMAFTPDSAITLLRITSTIEVAGVIGGGDAIRCNTAAGVGITVTSSAGAVAGTVTTATGSAAIPYQTTVSCHIDSTATTRPIASVVLEYFTP